MVAEEGIHVGEEVCGGEERGVGGRAWACAMPAARARAGFGPGCARGGRADREFGGRGEAG